MYCSFSHSAENSEKIEEQAYIYRRIRQYPTEEDEEEERIIRREEEEEEEERNKQINTDEIFKSDECVICLTDLPNVLFCNCGHIPICVECDKTKSLKDCPICKTENTIKRMLN